MTARDGRGMSAMQLAAVLKDLAETAAERAEEARLAAGDVFDRDDTSQSRPKLGGQEIATIYTSGGGPGQLSVTDWEAFTAWVTENFPDEVEPVVRKAFRDQLLREVRARGEAVNAAGEKIPGIGMTAGGGTVVNVKLRDDARQVIERARQAGLVPAVTELLYPAAAPAEEGEAGGPGPGAGGEVDQIT